MIERYQVQAIPKRGPKDRKPITIEVKAESQKEAEDHVARTCLDVEVQRSNSTPTAAK